MRHRIKTFAPWIVLLAIVLLGIFLRISGLEYFHFWGDDAYHLLLANDFNGNFAEHSSRDTHPAFYYLLVKIYILLFGVDSKLGLRSVSLLSGIGSIGLAFTFGRSLTDKIWCGVALAFLVCLSPIMIEQSQTIRGYSLLVFLLIPMIWLVLLPKFGRQQLLLGLSITGLACITHYSAIVVAACTGLIGLIRIYREWDRQKKWGLAVWSFFHLVFAGIVLYLGTRWKVSISESYIGESTYQSFLELVSLIPRVMNGFFFSNNAYAIIFISVIFLVGTYLICQARRFDLLVLSLGPFFLAGVLSAFQLYPIHSGRWCLYLLPSTLIPFAWMFKEFLEAKKFILITLFFGFFASFHLAAAKNIFMPDSHRRNTHWALKSEDMKLDFSHMLQPRFGQFPIILDDSIVQAVRMELSLQTNWRVFRPRPSGYIPCKVYSINKNNYVDSICSCLKIAIASQQDRTDFYLYATKLKATDISSPINSCYTIVSLHPLSEGSLLELKYIN